MSGSPTQGGQLNASQINDAMSQFGGFSPAGNIDNRITDNRSSGPLAAMRDNPQLQRLAQTTAKYAGPSQGYQPAVLPMMDPMMAQTMQSLEGLLAHSKENKQAIAKAFMGGG